MMWWTFPIWWGFQYLQISSKNMAQNVIYSSWGRTKGLWLCLKAKVIILSCFTAFLCFCIFPCFLDWVYSLANFFYGLKAGGIPWGWGSLSQEGPIRPCSVTMLPKWLSWPWSWCRALNFTRIHFLSPCVPLPGVVSVQVITYCRSWKSYYNSYSSSSQSPVPQTISCTAQIRLFSQQHWSFICPFHCISICIDGKIAGASAQIKTVILKCYIATTVFTTARPSQYMILKVSFADKCPW